MARSTGSGQRISRAHVLQNVGDSVEARSIPIGGGGELGIEPLMERRDVLWLIIQAPSPSPLQRPPDGEAAAKEAPLGLFAVIIDEARRRGRYLTGMLRRKVDRPSLLCIDRRWTIRQTARQPCLIGSLWRGYMRSGL